MQQQVEVTERELAQLIRTCVQVDAAFGPGWVALRWEDSQPIPEAVKRLRLMRGVSNEDTASAGT